jgi:hypothetical protein
MRGGALTWMCQPLGLYEMHGRVVISSRSSMLLRDYGKKERGREGAVERLSGDVERRLGGPRQLSGVGDANSQLRYLADVWAGGYEGLRFSCMRRSQV